LFMFPILILYIPHDSEMDKLFLQEYIFNNDDTMSPNEFPAIPIIDD